MAELLLRVADKRNHDDPELDAMFLKRGDVVTIQEDGWGWSAAELEGTKALAVGATLDDIAKLAHPWVVLKVPGIPVSTVSAFAVHDHGDPHENLLPRRRAFAFDVAKWVADGMPALTPAKALSYKVARPPRSAAL